MRQLMSKKEAANFVGFHPEHVMRLCRAGKFPRPIKLGSTSNCAVRFVADEIQTWLAMRIAERDAVLLAPHVTKCGIALVAHRSMFAREESSPRGRNRNKPKPQSLER
jgi:predicted DNA-binding transcriptional regulator AlpA